MACEAGQKRRKGVPFRTGDAGGKSAENVIHLPYFLWAIEIKRLLTNIKTGYGNIDGKGRVFMHRTILASIMILLVSGMAHAAGPAAPHEPAPAQAGATQIETDQKTGAVKIIVNGKEVARFDAKGLHVKDSIDYGGLLTDAGSSDAEYAKRIKAEPKH